MLPHNFSKSKLIISLILLQTGIINIGCSSAWAITKTNIKQNYVAFEQQQYAAIPTGWTTIIGNNGISLSLPPSYQGGNPLTELDTIAQKLKSIVPDYQQRLEIIRQSPVPIELFAFASQLDSVGFLTNVNIVSETVPSGVTVEEYLKTNVQQLSDYYQIKEHGIVNLNQVRGGKIIAELPLEGISIKQVFYVIPQGNTFWVVVFSSSGTSFNQNLPKFEQSIRTFSVIN